MWKLSEKLAGLLPVSDRNISLDFKIKQALSGMGYHDGVRNQIWLGAFSPDKQVQLLAKPEEINYSFRKIYEEIENYSSKSSHLDYVNRICYLYQKTYLQDGILTKVDRASMACSLEVRAPFLDCNLVEYVNSIPGYLKSTGMSTKKILKKAFLNYLPETIVRRPKKGFGIPISKWFKGELKDELKRIFAKDKIEKEGFFNYSYINGLLEDHWAQKRDNRKQIWTLLMFEKWYEKYCGNY